MARTRRFVTLLLLVLLAGLTPLSLIGADTHVGPDSGLALQELIDSLEPGATVIMAPGEYEGPIILRQPISVVSSTPLSPYVHPDMLSLDRRTTGVLITGGIVAQADRIYLQGLHTMPNEDGISLGFRIEAGDASLVQCSSYRSNQFGLYCAPHTRVSGTSLEIIDSLDVGILVSTESSLNLRGSVVMACDSTGIQCQGTLVASDSVISLNGYGSNTTEASDDGHGIQVLGNGTCWLGDCSINSNKGYGIDSPWNGDCEDGLCRSVEGQGNTIPPYGDRNRKGTTSFDHDLALPIGFFNDSWVYEAYFSWEYADERFSLDLSWRLDLAEVAWENSYSVFEFPEVEESVATADVLDDLASQLLTLAHEAGLTSDQDISQFVASFIGESLWYDYSRADYDEWGTYTPIVTLVRKSGVCRDFSVLLASLLKRSGYTVVCVALPNLIEGESGHMIVGIQIENGSGSFVQFEDEKYFLLDPTPGSSHILGGLNLDKWGVPDVISLNDEPDPNLAVSMDWMGVLSVSPTGESKAMILSVTLSNNGRAATESSWIYADAKWVGMADIFDDTGRSATIWIPALASEESFTVQIAVRVPEDVENVLLHVTGLDSEGRKYFGESLGWQELEN
jgi:hypothetical protein